MKIRQPIPVIGRDPALTLAITTAIRRREARRLLVRTFFAWLASLPTRTIELEPAPHLTCGVRLKTETSRLCKLSSPTP